MERRHNAALAALTERARIELGMMSYPNMPWVAKGSHASGDKTFDVVIVGAGQAGMTAAATLLRDSVSNIVILDCESEGREGPWLRYARMAQLRTPKHQTGIDTGLPSLSAQGWYEARHGVGSWAAIDRIPRADWAAYLQWIRQTLALPVRNGVAVTGIEPEGDWIAVNAVTAAGRERLLARHVVLATGFEGAGGWQVPPEYARALPPTHFTHANTEFDLDILKGKRVGILGHGASAFDNAVVALDRGATRVDLCFRREQIPTINPHRHLEYAGLLRHYPELEDALRWNIAMHFDAVDQPPTQLAYDRAHWWPNFHMRPGTPWLEVGYADGVIGVKTPARVLEFDYVIFATGAGLDLKSRAELASFADHVLRWRDRCAEASSAAHPFLGDYPYLGPHYEFLERQAGERPWLKRIHAFSFAAYVSMGPHSTSASALKYSAPRLAAGITGSLMRAQQHGVMDALRAYAVKELNEPGSTPAPAATVKPGLSAAAAR